MYGYWTNIEISNGVVQNKPVAIIACPEAIKKAEPDRKYFALKSCVTRYLNESIKLPGGVIGHYRVYKDAGAAAAWINRLSSEYFERIKAEPTPLPNPARFTIRFFGGASRYQISQNPQLQLLLQPQQYSTPLQIDLL